MTIARGVLGGDGWELAHAEVVDDEQRDGGEVREGGLAGPGELRIGGLVDERVGLAVEDAMALLDGHAGGLSEVGSSPCRVDSEENVSAPWKKKLVGRDGIENAHSRIFRSRPEIV